MQGARHQHVTPGESSHSGSFTPIVLCRSHCSRTTDTSPLQPKGLRVRVSRGLSLRTFPRKGQRSVPSSMHTTSGTTHKNPGCQVCPARSSSLLCPASSPSPQFSCSDTLDTFASFSSPPLLLAHWLLCNGQKRAAEPSHTVPTTGLHQAPWEAGPWPTH